jgi:hypothetical protein
MSTATQLKIRGMGLAAAKHEDSLKAAQFIAELLGWKQQIVSINDVRKYIKGLANASGSVFSGPAWEPWGWEAADHKEGHSRCVRTWRYRGNRVSGCELG